MAELRGRPFIDPELDPEAWERQFALWDRPEWEPYFNRIIFPDVLDVELTGRCMFRCPDCWGPKHNLSSELGLEEWKALFSEIFRYEGAEKIVLTGGEPLNFKGIAELAGFLASSCRDVTLSTTGVDDYGQLADTLPHLAEIGIPVDGPTAYANAIWRKSRRFSDGGLSSAIGALTLAQENPKLAITVRTVVHGANLGEVSKIPDFLLQKGVVIANMRWKLYLLNKHLGPERAKVWFMTQITLLL